MRLVWCKLVDDWLYFCKFVNNMDDLKQVQNAKKLIAARLLSARRMAGLSLQDLADKMGNDVTKQSLSKYENGKMKPDAKGLLALANALNISVDYLYSIPAVNVKLENIEYRKKSVKLSSIDDAIVIERAVDVFERYLELEDLLQLNDKYEYFVFDRLVLTAQDAEEAAAELRNVWELGNDPIPDVVEMLEDKGYLVVDIDAPDGFDGMKANVGDRKVVVLKKVLHNELNDIVRKRFTALHELAHHVLKFPNDLRSKERELLCHIFASAFLYPADMARKELLGARFRFFERELIILKERWGISFLAIFHRANHLGILNDSVLRKLNMGFRKRGYHLYNAEPGRFSSREVPTRMERLVFLGLAKEVLTINEAAFLAGMGAWKLREQMQLMI